MTGDLLHLHKSAITEAVGGQAAVDRHMGAGAQILDSNPILDDDGDRFLVPVMKEYETSRPAPTGTSALSKKELFILSMIYSRVNHQLKTKKLQLNPQEQKSFNRIDPKAKNWGPNFLRFLMLMNNKPMLFGRFGRMKELPAIQAMQRRLRIAPPLLRGMRKPGRYQVLTVMTAGGTAAQRLQNRANAFPNADPALSVEPGARARVMQNRRKPSFVPPYRKYQALYDMPKPEPQPQWLNDRLKKEIEMGRKADLEAVRPAYVAEAGSKPSTLAYTG